MGSAFSIGAITPDNLKVLALFLAANLLLVGHIFAFNDWAAMAQNAQQPNKATALVYSGKITSRFLLFFSVTLLAAALVFFALLGLRSLVLAVAIAGLGFLYSHPALNGKSIPIISSLLHFVGGLLHFFLGYAVFSAIDQRAILVGLFFALTFAAGHLNQEVRDFDLDQQEGARTNAVAFGKQQSFFAGLILFTFCYLYLFFLAWFGVVPRPLMFFSIFLWPVHLFWSGRTLRHGLTLENACRLQARYRALYAVIGLGLLLTLFWL